MLDRSEVPRSNLNMNARTQTEIDVNESEIYLNETEINLNEFEINLNECM